MDLPGWQKIYEELKGDGFELIAVAEDSGGLEDAGPYYDRANVTFTALVDPQHQVTALYGMINVPMGVWIDEQGHVVRTPEVAYSRPYSFGTLNVGHKRYVDGLRDWVLRGEESPYRLDEGEVTTRLKSTNPTRNQADAHFALAVFLHEAGRNEEADRHWERSQELDPSNWNYHRQQWRFDPSTSSQKWARKFQQLGGLPYYDDIEFPPEAEGGDDGGEKPLDDESRTVRDAG